MTAIAEIEEQLRTRSGDWESWLVYADWLSDHGDPRGALIALQHRLEMDPPQGEARRRLEREIEAIESEHRQHWLPELARAQASVTLRHGFAWEARFEGGTALAAFQSLIAHPGGRLLVSARFERLPAEHIEALMGALVGSRLLRLALVDSSWDAPAGRTLARTLAKTARMPTLRALDLHNNALGDEGIAHIARAGRFAGIERLGLEHNRLGHAGAEALAEALSGTSVLSLGGNDIGARGVEAIASCAGAAGLRSLDLSHNRLGREGALVLARAESLGALTRLDLWLDEIGDTGGIVLANSPVVRRLAVLNLGGNRLGDTAAEAIARSENLRRLTRLDLWSNQITDTGALALARSPVLRLSTIHLGQNRIGPDGRSALAESRAWPPGACRI